MIIKYEEFDFFQYGFAIAMVLGVIITLGLKEFVFSGSLGRDAFL